MRSSDFFTSPIYFCFFSGSSFQILWASAQVTLPDRPIHGALSKSLPVKESGHRKSDGLTLKMQYRLSRIFGTVSIGTGEPFGSTPDCITIFCSSGGNVDKSIAG